jgi:hypothetical protein
MFGLFSSQTNSSSVLSNVNERILQLVSGPLDYTKMSRFAYVLSNQHLQKWKIPFVSSDTLLWEISISKFAKSLFPDAQDVQVIDMNLGKANNFVFLVQTQDFPQAKANYAVVTARESENNLEVISMTPLALSVHPDPSNPPRLHTSNGGPVALVCFPDKIVILMLGTEFEFEEIVPLKRKELIACGVDTSRIEESAIEMEMIACAYGTVVGPLEIRLAVSELMKQLKPRIQDPLVHENRHDSFYSKLEQIVFFASEEQGLNPIAFDIRNMPGDIDHACLELSSSILKGSNQHIPNLLDDSGVLNDCMLRMDNIIQTLNHFDLANLLRPETRFQLMFNAEKLHAMTALWHHQNSIFNSENDEEFLKLLEYCATGFMSKHTHESSIRQFFKRESSRVAEFVLFIHNQLQATSNDEKLIFEHGNLLSVYLVDNRWCIMLLSNIGHKINRITSLIQVL